MSKRIDRIRVPLFESQRTLVDEAVRKGQLVRGPHLELLAERLADMFGKRYAVLTSNGFSALFASLKVATPQPTKVLTASASTCFAMVNAIKAAGHQPVFADLESRSASIAAIDCSENQEGCAIALVPDHFGMIAPYCQMPRVDGRYLIEDAAQSFLSRTQIPTDADIVVLSFYPTKVVNGIDGGAVLTDDPDIFQGVRKLISYTNQHEFEDAPRFNLAMNNVNAAFALGTLEHVAELRSALAAGYRGLREVAERNGLGTLEPRGEEIASRFIAVCDTSERRNTLLERLASTGIPAAKELLWVCPGAEQRRFPGAAKLIDTTLSLPLHPLTHSTDIEAIDAGIMSQAATLIY